MLRRPAPAPTRKVTGCVTSTPKQDIFMLIAMSHDKLSGYREEEIQDVVESDTGTRRAPFACSAFGRPGHSNTV